MVGNVGLAERADAQLVSVNGISLDEAHERYGRAHAQWADRSSRARTVRIAPELVERYPVLAGVQLAPD